MTRVFAEIEVIDTKKGITSEWFPITSYDVIKKQATIIFYGTPVIIPTDIIIGFKARKYRVLKYN